MPPEATLPKRLPLVRVRAGARWMRIHAGGRNALWFGPDRGQPPVHRFDDPGRQFGVCYFGTTIEVCFAETFLRNPPVRILALDDLAACFIATVELRRDLRLVPLHGPGLARLGVTAELASGSDYAASRLCACALWEHSDQPDGILYRSRHDDSALCAALYDRAKESLAIVEDHSLAASPPGLAKLLRRYGVALTN